MQKRLARITLAFAALVLFAACSVAGAQDKSNSASDVKCEDVLVQITQAGTDLTSKTTAADDAKGTPDESNANKAKEAAQQYLDGLTERQKECESTSSSSSPGDGSTVIVTEANGQQHSLPLVEGGSPVMGDSTGDTRTPPTYADAKAKGPAQSWQQLVDLMGGQQWYIDGINARKDVTGFGWDDIVKWSTAKDDMGPIDARVIQVYNWPDLSDQDARNAVRQLVGDVADTLQLDRHNCIENTRGFGHEQMENFVDCRKMVRVSLSPIVYDTNGKPVMLRSDAGVFIDCFNLWWIPPKIEKPGSSTTTTTQPSNQSTTTQPSNTTSTVPSTTTSTTAPPCASGKCVPATTAPPPPTTTPPPATVPLNNGGQGDSGSGATNTTSPPTTVAPPPAPPTTDSPDSNPPPPSG